MNFFESKFVRVEPAQLPNTSWVLGVAWDAVPKICGLASCADSSNYCIREPGHVFLLPVVILTSFYPRQ